MTTDALKRKWQKEKFTPANYDKIDDKYLSDFAGDVAQTIADSSGGAGGSGSVNDQNGLFKAYRLFTQAEIDANGGFGEAYENLKYSTCCIQTEVKIEFARYPNQPEIKNLVLVAVWDPHAAADHWVHVDGSFRDGDLTPAKFVPKDSAEAKYGYVRRDTSPASITDWHVGELSIWQVGGKDVFATAKQAGGTFPAFTGLESAYWKPAAEPVPGTGQLTAAQVAAFKPTASASNQLVLDDDYRLTNFLLRKLELGLECYMYGLEDATSPNKYGRDGTAGAHFDNIYGFGTSANTFGDSVSINEYGNGLYNCTFGDNISGNKFGSYVSDGVFGDYLIGSIIGNNASRIRTGFNTRYLKIGDDSADITTGKNNLECEVGPNCYGVIFEDNCRNVKVFDTRKGTDPAADPTSSNTLVIPAGTQNAVYRRGVPVPSSGTSSAAVATPAGTVLVFTQDAEYAPIYNGTFTVDPTGAKVGTVVFVELGAAAGQPTLDANVFELEGSNTYQAGKRFDYGFRVAASGKIHYIINPLP